MHMFAGEFIVRLLAAGAGIQKNIPPQIFWYFGCKATRMTLTLNGRISKELSSVRPPVEVPDASGLFERVCL